MTYYRVAFLYTPNSDNSDNAWNVNTGNVNNNNVNNGIGVRPAFYIMRFY